MSANNYLLITEEKDSWTVEENDADTGNGTVLESFKTLKKAVKFAQKYLYENIVEYGIHFKFLEEKE
jgi:hypothetical protein